MKQKIQNDTLAFLRSYVSRRGRNVDAAQDAVTNSKSYTEQEAQQLHLIDVIAPNDAALLDAAGWADGDSALMAATAVLHTRGASLVAGGADAAARRSWTG